MRNFLMLIFGLVFSVTLSAAVPDSLEQKGVYQKAWQIAMQDGKISSAERPLLDILGETQGISRDSSRSWEIQWRGPSMAVLDQSGRWPLVAQNMALGVGLYGWAVPYVLHAKDYRWIVGSEMLSLGSAFYLTYRYTRDKPISHARAQMLRFGSLLGLRYGAGVNLLLDLDSGDTDLEGADPETLWAWVLMGSVPVGHYAGSYLFDRYDPSNGQAWAWTMWTGIAGMTTRLIHGAIDQAPTPPDYYYYDPVTEAAYDRDLNKWNKRKTRLELLSYPLGVLGGYYLTRDKVYSFGDALLLTQGWAYGYFNSMMLQSLLFDDGDEDIFFMNSALGAIAGTYAYDRFIRDKDYSVGQSILMLLGSGSGLAFGMGTAVILDNENMDLFFSLALAGYGAGTWFTHKILDPAADGSLATNDQTQISISPTLLFASGAGATTTLRPGLAMNISFP